MSSEEITNYEDFLLNSEFVDELFGRVDKDRFLYPGKYRNQKDASVTIIPNDRKNGEGNTS